MNYDALPLPASAYGRRLYARGRTLVADHGLRLDEVMWDADEVLWDWLLQGVRLAGGLWRAVLLKNYAHTEYIAARPGMFELLWGMRHEALERGDDPDVRIWTSGYAWRVWRISRQIPGLSELLGLPANADAATYAKAGTFFSRPDFARAALMLVNARVPEGLLAHASDASKAVITRHLDDKLTSALKVPDLAALVGKDGFGRVRILVDDLQTNIDRFVETGRLGVHVVSHAPRIVFGAVPNSVWGRPGTHLARPAPDHANAVADALEEALATGGSGVFRAEPPVGPVTEVPAPFKLGIPNARVQAGLSQPIRDLRTAMRMQARRSRL
ncbi:MAG: hypothetical protein ACI9MR_004862 [Myxococcota bacterium]|jgi:hypothetical protein